MDYVKMFIEAFASRPEIMGIVLVSWIMYRMVTVKRPKKEQGQKTPYYDHVIKAQLWAIKFFGAVIVIRAVGESIAPDWKVILELLK